MLKSYSLKFKILSLCFFLISMTLVVGLMSYQSLAAVENNYSFIPEKVMPKLDYLNEMFLDYRRIRITLQSLGIEGISPQMASTAVADAEQAIADYEKAQQAYVDLQFIPGQKEAYEKVNETWLVFKKTSEKIISLHNAGTPESRSAMINIFFTDSPAVAKAYTQAALELKDFHKKAAEKVVSQADAAGHDANQRTVLVVIFSAIVGLVSGFFFSSFLSKQLNAIAAEVTSAAEQTSSASSQLTLASTQLSSGSSESASSLQETVASLDELTSMVKRNTENSAEASHLAKKSHEEAESGEQEIVKLISAMSEISGSSKKIEEIINVIDDIAFQTNLLALNAAVEAARAGEQGRGFAVVAEAVRALAQRSSVAAKDISTLIQENVSKSQQGTKIADSSGQVFKSIVHSVKKMADLSGEIATGSKEQAAGIQQISIAMNQLDQATQGNASSAEEVAASSEEMSAQANTLVQLVSNLKGVISGAKDDATFVGMQPNKQGIHANTFNRAA